MIVLEIMSRTNNVATKVNRYRLLELLPPEEEDWEPDEVVGAAVVELLIVLRDEDSAQS